ncbi:MAG: hypothetical protein KKA59_06260 [Candidatus Omnitrophica bacterium]|nr:hypothetical protein [Candidatus Omnitrophota bacterium]
MFKHAAKSSFFLLLAIKIHFGYSLLERDYNIVFRNSRLFMLMKAFYKRLKTNFRNSFIRNMFEAGIGSYIRIAMKSIFFRKLLYIPGSFLIMVNNYENTGAIIWIKRMIKKKSPFLPIQTISIIIVSAILTNIFLLLLFHAEIGNSAWFIRSILFFLGISGLFCNADWRGIRKTSLVLRYVNNYCTI